MRVWRWWLLLLATACSPPAPDAAAPLLLWHTFGPEETQAVNDALAARRGPRVAATVLPFGRAQNRIAHVLARGEGCPDLVRIDATWLPDLAGRELLVAPDPAWLDGFTAEALELAAWSGRAWGLPQTVDGLALIYDVEAVKAAGVAWPPTTLAQLESAARALHTDGRYGISVRADGYWFAAWLRAAGGDLVAADGDVRIAEPAAAEALGRYAALVRDGVAPAPSPSGDEAALEARRFVNREVAVFVGGPWSVSAVSAARDRLGVAPYPRDPAGRPAAPRGGHLWVVPRCARDAAGGWALARELTAPALQATWSQRLGLVPTRAEALGAAHPLARAFAEALSWARPLPRHPLTPVLFDDLTPAVQAVLAGEATAEEALDGVARGWTRLLAEGP